MTTLHLDPLRARRALAAVSVTEHLDDDAIAERYARVVWNTLAEPGDGVAGRLIAACGARGALLALSGAIPVAPPPGVTEKELEDGWRRWMPRLASPFANDALARAAARGVRLVLPGDEAWPHHVDDLGMFAPLALWVRGDPQVLQALQPSIALVGARAATSYGEHIAGELAAELAATGIPIVSGAAYGIDAAAHRSALAVGGLTVALLAGGVERPYPAGNAGLIDRIAAAGAVVSEVPCGGTPTKWRFLQRNRLIAALADATVVVEAGWRSGSLNTAGHATALGRPTGAVPGPVTSAASAGCHRMLREFGAQCVTTAAEARELLGLSHSDGSSVSATGPAALTSRPRTDERTRVVDALSTRAWRTSDDVARRSGMSRTEVEALLGLLLLDGDVERGDDRWRRTGAVRVG